MHFRQCREISSLHNIPKIRGRTDEIVLLFVIITLECTDRI